MTTSIHYPILQAIGLNENEALVYQLLLELGPKPAQNLIEPSGLGRGNLYNTLNALKEKGLIMEESGTKKIYQAVDPENLRKLAKTQVISAQETLNQLESTLPTLKSAFRLITKKPTFRIFEGIEGIKDVYKEMLQANQPIHSLVGLGDASKELNKWLHTYYIKERLKRGIHVQGVVSSDERGQELLEHQEEELRHVALIDKQQFPYSGDISVFGESIAFMDHRNEIATIIENAQLAQTLRSTIQALMICRL
ncbi:MAG: hypothetical protein O2877_00905 [bacterium]|nr:hypothetical protein [bacterium]